MLSFVHRSQIRSLLKLIIGGLLILGLNACNAHPIIEKQSLKQSVEKREFNPTLNGLWIGNGISYAPYRDGESPALHSLTSKQHILEDLRLIARRWNLIRMYSADAQSRRVLEVIAEHDLPIRVMQGAWISKHQSQQENDKQIQSLIELANAYPKIIVALNVGNEIFVDWSWHKIDDVKGVIEYIRQVRRQVRQPVTVNDDYNFWNKPHAQRIANEVDFIGLHAYAFWNNQTIDQALPWTISIYRDIQARYPDQRIAFTETGWPTSRVYDDSYEGRLVGAANPKNQKKFFDAYDDWVDSNHVISIYFEAFDEKWKGGFDGDNPMDKAEKHWGLFFSDRTPKAAIE